MQRARHIVRAMSLAEAPPWLDARFFTRQRLREMQLAVPAIGSLARIQRLLTREFGARCGIARARRAIARDTIARGVRDMSYSAPRTENE